MKKKNTSAEPQKTPEPVQEAPKQSDYPECLPIMRAVTKVKVGKRWQIVHLEIQGDKVIAKELIGPPQVAGLAGNAYKLESLKAHPEIL